jgi:hypothetical protein
MSMAKYSKGPWHVIDLRDSAMRSLGWAGESIDTILITNAAGRELQDCQGANSVVARIKFEHRPELLTDGNLADAHLIAAAPELVHPFRNADASDWRALDLLLGVTAQGNFWRAVFAEFRPALAKATPTPDAQGG